MTDAKKECVDCKRKIESTVNAICWNTYLGFKIASAGS